MGAQLIISQARSRGESSGGSANTVVARRARSRGVIVIYEMECYSDRFPKLNASEIECFTISAIVFQSNAPIL